MSPSWIKLLQSYVRNDMHTILGTKHMVPEMLLTWVTSLNTFWWMNITLLKNMVGEVHNHSGYESLTWRLELPLCTRLTSFVAHHESTHTPWFLEAHIVRVHGCGPRKGIGSKIICLWVTSWTDLTSTLTVDKHMVGGLRCRQNPNFTIHGVKAAVLGPSVLIAWQHGQPSSFATIVTLYLRTFSSSQHEIVDPV